MPRKNTALFSITIPVTCKMVDRAIERSIWDLDEYDRADLRAAGVNLTALRDELRADPAFLEQLSKQMIKSALQGVNCSLDEYDLGYNDHPLIRAAVKACEKAYTQREKSQAATHRLAAMRDAAQLLESAGYKISKG